MKLIIECVLIGGKLSRPTWGAWIETQRQIVWTVPPLVAPHVGRVD